MLKKIEKKILILAILITVANCSKKLTPAISGCGDFCEILPEPKKSMFEKNIDHATFDFLIEIHSIKKCGCIVDDTNKALCFQKYNN